MEFRFKLVIGIGNPGPKYANTYHNVGALFAKYLKDFRDKQQWINWKLLISISEVYVNDSGRFVAREMKNENVKPEELLIVHDDSDIEIGKYKLTPPGHGSAGHHGIESIQQHLKTNDFWRLRIGIRPKQAEGEVRLKALDFVLKKISSADKKLLEQAFEEAKKELSK